VKTSTSKGLGGEVCLSYSQYVVNRRLKAPYSVGEEISYHLPKTHTVAKIEATTGADVQQLYVQPGTVKLKDVFLRANDINTRS